MLVVIGRVGWMNVSLRMARSLVYKIWVFNIFLWLASGKHIEFSEFSNSAEEAATATCEILEGVAVVLLWYLWTVLGMWP